MAREAIDVFCHFMPKRFVTALEGATRSLPLMLERARHMPAMVDLAARFSVMDEFPDYQQIISLPGPPIEAVAPSREVELCHAANETLAQAVDESDGRFCGFAAAVPMTVPDAACVEIQRAVNQLGAVAVQIYTSVGGHPLDETRFETIFQISADLQCPVLLHPTRSITVPDYPGEKLSKFEFWWALGWPYETTLAMGRLAFSGLFERFPAIKVIAHHVGGYMPMLAGRLGPGMELMGTRQPKGTDDLPPPAIHEAPLMACRRFFADTASFGSQAAIECGVQFFGTERMLFATDMPFDPEQGPGYIRSTLAAINEMNLTESERTAILAGNARRLFKLVAG